MVGTVSRDLGWQEENEKSTFEQLLNCFSSRMNHKYSQILHECMNAFIVCTVRTLYPLTELCNASEAFSPQICLGTLLLI